MCGGKFFIKFLWILFYLVPKFVGLIRGIRGPPSIYHPFLLALFLLSSSQESLTPSCLLIVIIINQQHQFSSPLSTTITISLSASLTGDHQHRPCPSWLSTSSSILRHHHFISSVQVPSHSHHLHFSASFNSITIHCLHHHHLTSSYCAAAPVLTPSSTVSLLHRLCCCGFRCGCRCCACRCCSCCCLPVTFSSNVVSNCRSPRGDNFFLFQLPEFPSPVFFMVAVNLLLHRWSSDEL